MELDPPVRGASIQPTKLEPRSPPPVTLGIGQPRGYGSPPRLSPDAAAAFATYVDTARARAAVEGRTLVYTVRWS